jgi:hypothetical protein
MLQSKYLLRLLIILHRIRTRKQWLMCCVPHAAVDITLRPDQDGEGINQQGGMWHQSFESHSVDMAQCPHGSVFIWLSVHVAQCPYGSVFIFKNPSLIDVQN